MADKGFPGEKIAKVIVYKALGQTIQDPREVYGLANHLVKKSGGSWKQALRMMGQGGSKNVGS